MLDDAAQLFPRARQVWLANTLRALKNGAVAERAYRDAFGEFFGGRPWPGWSSVWPFLLELAETEGAAILESVSFRDDLQHLISKRDHDYSSAGDWLERIAAALLRKSRGGHPPNRADQTFDALKLSHFRVIRAALDQAAREVPAGLIDDAEILQDLRARGIVLHPPDDGLSVEPPPGYRDQQERNYQTNLPRLARHLEEFRKNRRARRVKRETIGTLDDHAIQIVLEGWGAAARYGPSSAAFTLDENGRLIATAPVEPDVDPVKARAELWRLKRNSNRRKKSRT